MRNRFRHFLVADALHSDDGGLRRSRNVGSGVCSLDEADGPRSSKIGCQE